MLIANTNSINAAARTDGDQLAMTLLLGRNTVIRLICEVRTRPFVYDLKEDVVTGAKGTEPHAQIAKSLSPLRTLS